MSLLLEKAKSAGLSLEKKGLPNPPIIRVAAAFDVSGSMQHMYQHGDVQNAFDQLLGASLKLDDNGEIDTYIFDFRHSKIGTASSSDYGTYVKTDILEANELWGGTQYAGVIEMVENDMFPRPKKGLLSALFGAKPPAADPSSTLPVLAFLITDGENSDHVDAEIALERSSNFPIYWNMIGIGNPDEFKFIRRMADKFDNVGFISLAGGLRISDDQMYESLFTDEFARWAKQFPPRS